MGMRIAMVGPWPPETSGIADYAADLAGQLEMRGVRVTRVNKADDMSAAPALLESHDLVVYQMGNHATHHAWMLPLMAQVPGVIHLHDIVLHHLVAIALDRQGCLTPEKYAQTLRGWYPPRARNLAVAALENGLPVWAQESVVSMPLFEPVVRAATGVIVHSEFAAKALRASFPYLPVHVVAQRYTISGERRQRSLLSTICIMGSGEKNRRFDWIADALERVNDELQHPLTVEIAGQLNPAVEQDVERIAKLGNIRLNLLGRVDDRQFESIFSRADVLIAFRHPTMGETSAVVSKALQYGLPTVVSDQGWYAELPSCVHKIEASDDAPIALSKFLLGHLDRPDAFAAWAAKCHAVAEYLVSGARQAARMYAGILAEAAAVARLRSRVADHLVAWKFDPDGILAGCVAGIDVQCGFPARAELELAMSAANRDAHKTLDEDETLAPSEPLPDSGFRCRLEVDLQGRSTAQKEMLELQVRIDNLSDVPYTSPRPSQPPDFGIFIGYHWHKKGESTALDENPRTRLVEQVAPQGSSSQTMRVKVPEEAGDYDLIIDLVQEQVAWFRHKEGIPAVLAVSVDTDQIFICPA